MKVQIAEARLRGDIETRGFLPREYLRRATRPLPPSYPCPTNPDTRKTVSREKLPTLRLEFSPESFPPRVSPRVLCSRNFAGCNTLSSHNVIIIFLTHLVRKNAKLTTRYYTLALPSSNLFMSASCLVKLFLDFLKNMNYLNNIALRKNMQIIH